MEVPFSSSKAVNRAHYALVRDVESSASPEIADSYILKEMRSIQSRLRYPSISLKETRDCLIVLLYCAGTSTSLPRGTMDFALPQAANLAQVGNSVAEKRIGYLFCAEIMTEDHELRLLLVNTLRKDLESDAEATICLALDNLISSPSDAVIPAIQSRLKDLLSHPSPHIRRRALAASAALARFEPEILKSIRSKVLKRLRDPDPAVVCAALNVSAKLHENDASAGEDLRGVLNELLKSFWEDVGRQSVRCNLLQTLHLLRKFGLDEVNLGLVLEIIHQTSVSGDHPVMCGAFLNLSGRDPASLLKAQTSEKLSPISNIRALLNSQSVTDHYIFLSCLTCLPPSLWSGSEPDSPAAFDEWEVGRVMALLDSPDPAIRQKTLRILNTIDENIINSYYLRCLQTLPIDLPANMLSNYAARFLQIIETQTDGDGELYARLLIDLFTQMEARSPAYAQIVIESAVEGVLSHIRAASTPYQIGCATALLTSCADLEKYFGQTMMVILSALSTEYAGALVVPAIEILSGISTRLSSCIPAVQDACLLAMMRLSADCERMPSEVLDGVGGLAKQCSRHIRRRCAEFISLSSRKDDLAEIVRSANSSALPDFLEALIAYENRAAPTSEDKPASVSKPASLPKNRLRYEAYEAPKTTPRLRDRPDLAKSSSRSASSSGPRNSPTAGDLAATPQPTELRMATDLIAFHDSPFASDPDTPDFANFWDSLDESSSARGWCDLSLEDVNKRLESLDILVIPAETAPFLGEVKVLMNGDSGSQPIGALRLKASEEGGCLWRFRSGDAQLRVRVKRLLE